VLGSALGESSLSVALEQVLSGDWELLESWGLVAGMELLSKIREVPVEPVSRQFQAGLVLLGGLAGVHQEWMIARRALMKIPGAKEKQQRATVGYQ